MADKHVDELSGVETTGHEWDGIRELNNPLPRWWLWTFYATILWAAVYTVLYPAWPLVNSATSGVLGWSSRGELAAELDGVRESQRAMVERIAVTPLPEILADAELANFANAAGRSAFLVNCVQCHGSGATGGPGYPNLNDNEWIWGGDIEEIYQTVAHGIRDPLDEDTRFSEMTAFADVLEPEEIRQVAAYVVSLTGRPRTPSLVEPGRQVYADNCASCHGENAEGSRDLGSPSLADAIWLRTNGEDEIIAQIRAPKHGVMPAWGGRLGEVTVKQLAVYVHRLGGGE